MHDIRHGRARNVLVTSLPHEMIFFGLIGSAQTSPTSLFCFQNCLFDSMSHIPRSPLEVLDGDTLSKDELGPRKSLNTYIDGKRTHPAIIACLSPRSA